MEVDRNGLVVLSRDECLRRLRRPGVGRVGLSVGALPAIFPVNYTLFRDDVYFRTAPGTKLVAAARNAIVAFEVDRIEPISHNGWSVLVVGPSEVVSEPAELARLARSLSPWIGDGADVLVRIRAELISGRQIVHPAVRPAARTG